MWRPPDANKTENRARVKLLVGPSPGSTRCRCSVQFTTGDVLCSSRVSSRTAPEGGVEGLRAGYQNLAFICQHVRSGSSFLFVEVVSLSRRIGSLLFFVLSRCSQGCGVLWGLFFAPPHLTRVAAPPLWSEVGAGLQPGLVGWCQQCWSWPSLPTVSGTVSPQGALPRHLHQESTMLAEKRLGRFR